MRAVGYVAPHRLPIGLARDDEDGPDRVTWSAVVEPSAGSWGVAETGGVASEPMPDHPAERIVRYCADNGHNLVAILGVEGGSVGLSEQLGLVAPDIDGSAPDSDGQQFDYLLSALTPPAGHPALVLIHDARHLANDVETLIRRLIQIRRTGSDTQCTDPEMPDPLQSGLSALPLTDGSAQRDASAASPETDARTDSQSPATKTRRGDIPKVIALASNGKVLGRTPYGYRSNDEGTLEPVPHEAQIVRQVFDWYVGNDGTDPVGMRSIVQRLDSADLRTRTGKRWSTASVSVMLKNKAYIGTYGRYGFLVAGNHEPLIERPTWNAAQRKMADRSASGVVADTDAAFLLGGLVRCASCGHGIPGLSRKRSWRRKDDSVASKTYRYYEFAECPKRRKTRGSNLLPAAASSAEADGGCPSWRAESLESVVKERISNLSFDELGDVVPRDDGADLADRLDAARSKFSASVRKVATGRGDIEHLLPEIEKMDAIRQQLAVREATARRGGSVTKSRNRRLVADHVATVAADIDWQASREALHAIVDIVSVGCEDAEISLWRG